MKELLATMMGTKVYEVINDVTGDLEGIAFEGKKIKTKGQDSAAEVTVCIGAEQVKMDETKMMKVEPALTQKVKSQDRKTTDITVGWRKL